jgi:hypothetical protein
LHLLLMLSEGTSDVFKTNIVSLSHIL